MLRISAGVTDVLNFITEDFH